jgi:hypothetical protein
MVVILKQRSTRPRRAAILVWAALSLAVIVGVLAINLDGGRLLEERRNVQSAADAAALAGGATLYSNYWTYNGKDPTGAAAASAVAAAVANGIPSGSVTVNIPPQSGIYAGTAGYVEVLIQNNVNGSFGAIFTNSPLPVAARSVARGLPMQIGMIMLQPSGPNAFLNQSPVFTLINAPLIVNSTDAAAFDQASFGAVVASRYDITGGYTNPGGALILGTMNTGTSPVPDPLQFLPIPSTSGATVRSSTPMTVNSMLPTVLQPGIYQGGIHVTNLASVVMEPGVYIVQGGGFVVDSEASALGLGVMVYNTTSTSYAAGPISVTSVGKVTLTAPMSGTYQGINFFQDRSLTNPVTLSGEGLAAITGTVYAASAPASLTGGLAVGLNVLGGAFVVNSMTVKGIGAINVNIGLNPPRVPDVRLVE